MSPVPGLSTPKVAIVCVWDCELLVATSTVSIWYSVRTKPVMLEKVVAEQLRLCSAMTERSCIWWFCSAGDAAACEANSRPVRKNVRRTIVTMRGIGIPAKEVIMKRRQKTFSPRFIRVCGEENTAFFISTRGILSGMYR